jgi:hypothetical protein
MASKDLADMHFMDWIRSPRKGFSNSSICWRELVEAFPLIGNWLRWHMGNRKSIRIGEDPWVNSGQNHKLSEDLIHEFHGQGIFTIWDVGIGGQDAYGISSWKSTKYLSLEGKLEA